MATFYLVLVLSLSSLLLLPAQKLPDFRGKDLTNNKYAVRVKECYLKDKANFEGCLLSFWLEVVPLLTKGVPELGIPPLDPLLIDRLHFNEKSASIQAEATFTNIKAIGASKVIPRSVKVDPKAKLVTITISIPYLNITGNYVVKGTIMLLPIEGKGNFVLNLGTIEAVAKANIVQHGTGVKTNKVTLDFNIGSIFVKLDGLLGGDEVGVAVNNMLNDNGQQIFQDIKPEITRRMEETFLNMTSGAFVDMPPNAFIA